MSKSIEQLSAELETTIAYLNQTREQLALANTRIDDLCGNIDALEHEKMLDKRKIENMGKQWDDVYSRCKLTLVNVRDMLQAMERDRTTHERRAGQIDLLIAYLGTKISNVERAGYENEALEIPF